MPTLDLKSIVERLEKLHGKPKAPNFGGLLEMILWENVAYLADDEKRELAFNALRERVGVTPQEILSASPGALRAVTETAGILPRNQVQKLCRIAEIARDEFDSDLDQILRRPIEQARTALKKFPGIGNPGAEKILLFCRAQPILALDSNGLRVLLRLGFGTEQKNYAASYRSAQESAQQGLKADCRWLIRAYQLLRKHGQETCRRNRPNCGVCPLVRCCQYYQEADSRPNALKR